MPPLPLLSGREVARVFQKAGWELVRQRSSHMVLTKEGSWASLSVPDHREVAQGTLRGLVRAAGMSTDEFVALTKK